MSELLDELAYDPDEEDDDSLAGWLLNPNATTDLGALRQSGVLHYERQPAQEVGA